MSNSFDSVDLEQQWSSIPFGGARPSFADLRLSDRTITKVTLKGCNIDKVYSGSELVGGARAFSGSSWGFSTFAAVKKTAIKKALVDAARISRNIGRENKSRRNLEIEPSHATIDNRPKLDPTEIPLEDKVESLVEMSKSVPLSEDFELSYSETKEEWLITNNFGTDVRITKTGVSLEIFGKPRSVVFVQTFDRGGGFEVVFDEKIRQQAAEILRESRKFEEAPLVEGTRTDVILDPRAAGAFAHEAVGHVFESGPKKYPLKLLGHFGESVAPKSLTVYDDPDGNDWTPTYPYDSEGVRGHRVDLIKDGVLRDYLRSIEGALTGGRSSNGHARSQSARYPPLVRMTNLFVHPGDMNYLELLEESEGSLLAEGFVNASVDDIGNFSIKPSWGRLVQQGGTLTPVRVPLIMGNISTHLRKVACVAKDCQTSALNCGLSDQLLRVSATAPHILIRDVMVSTS